MWRRARFCFVGLAIAACVLAPSAWASSDPSANYPPGPMPAACSTAPTGATCVNAAVYYLDQARASLGQPPYALPADFTSLSAPEQTLILTNLDRILYGLTPITGLTADLNNDSYTSGVQAGADPSPSSTAGLNLWTANWAGGYPNMALAYEGWMYDDGPGSGNLDCTSSGDPGCWGHRHDILVQTTAGDLLAMGAAAGAGPNSVPGYAMLIVGGCGTCNPAYTPTYTYTWSQAVADGAGTNTYDPGLPQATVQVQITVVGPGTVSDGSGQSCSGSCNFSEAVGAALKLTAAPSSGANFSGWSGACTGSSLACALTPQGSLAVTARFASSGTARHVCIVPKLKGKKLRAARRALRHAHCRLGTIKRRFSNVKKGRIIAQRPRAGRHRRARTRVRLVISRGHRRS